MGPERALGWSVALHRRLHVARDAVARGGDHDDRGAVVAGVLVERLDRLGSDVHVGGEEDGHDLGVEDGFHDLLLESVGIETLPLRAIHYTELPSHLHRLARGLALVLLTQTRSETTPDVHVALEAHVRPGTRLGLPVHVGGRLLSAHVAVDAGDLGGCFCHDQTLPF